MEHLEHTELFSILVGTLSEAESSQDFVWPLRVGLKLYVRRNKSVIILVYWHIKIKIPYWFQQHWYHIPMGWTWLNYVWKHSTSCLENCDSARRCDQQSGTHHKQTTWVSQCRMLAPLNPRSATFFAEHFSCKCLEPDLVDAMWCFPWSSGNKSRHET